MGAPYISVSVSGYNVNSPSDDGSQTSTNKITWNSTIKGKIGDPILTMAQAVNSQLVTWSDFSSVTTSTNLTTNTSHHMQTIEVTSGSPTIQLGDAATMTKNYTVTVTNTGTGAPVIALATAGNTLDGTAAGTFTFPTGTATSFTFKVNNGATGYYTEKNGGKTILAQTSVVTPIVDSGSTGSLSLKTNNGTTQLVVDHIGSAVNALHITGNATGNKPQIIAEGSDPNIGLNLITAGNSSQDYYTGANGSGSGGAILQFQILHTASATRNITVTGSNGGNPTISTTAGSLAITPSVVCAAGIQLGTNPASASTSFLSTPYVGGVLSRNNANTGDINLVNSTTVNGVADICYVNSGGSGVQLRARSKAGAPTTSDIPAGDWALWRDTSGATTKLYYNNAGTLQSVSLA